MKLVRNGLTWLLAVALTITMIPVSFAGSADNAQDVQNEKANIEVQSMLPLNEVEAALVLNGYSEEQLKNMPLKDVLDMLQDNDGNHIKIADDAKIVWAHFKDESGNVIRDEYHEIERNETVDLSEHSYKKGYTMEMIVGSGNQLDSDNERYIVRVYLKNSINEAINFELYQEDDNGSRYKFEYVTVPVESVVLGKYIKTYQVYIPEGSSYDKNRETDVGITSLRDKHPRYSIGVFDSGSTDTTSYEYTRINDNVLNQDLKIQGSGYKLDNPNFFESIAGIGKVFRSYIYYNDNDSNKIDWDDFTFKKLLSGIDSGIYTSPNDFIGLYISISTKPVPDVFTLNNYDNSNIRTNIESEHNLSVDFDWDKIDMTDYMQGDMSSLSVNTIMTIEYSLKKGYDDNKEYYMLSPESYNIDENMKKIVLGHYNTLAEAENIPDVKDEFKDIGYKANYGGNGVKMTFFYADNTVQKYIFKAVQKHEKEPEYFSAPTVGIKDPFFRITGLKNNDSYTVENGGVYNLDTYYGYGYQAILLNDPDADLTSIYPEFWYAGKESDEEYFNFYRGQTPQKLEQAQDMSKANTQYSVAWKSDESKVRNYFLTVAKKVVGKPKLFVNGPSEREVCLDEYFENKHDVFIANIGDKPMYVTASLSDDAMNVKLDDYWTVGGDNNQYLDAFTVTSTTSDYSELPNVAKIRLIKDGDSDGCVSGKLIIESSGSLIDGALNKNDNYEKYVITLNGKAGSPEINTEKLDNAVKYIPYSNLITTNNIHEWNNVEFSLIDGELPDGVVLKPNGEVYGVPTETGTFKFKVKAHYSNDSFVDSEHELTLTVDENTDENVNAQIDDGYGVLVRVPEVNLAEANMSDQVFEFEYDYNAEEFQGFWLDGKLLTEGIDYDVESGSTKITIRAKTFANAGEGKHTIAAEYRNSKKELKKSAQNYSATKKTSDSSNTKPSGSNSGSSTGSTLQEYNISKLSIANGNIKIFPEKATAGKTVTITATPNAGYETVSVTVKDAKGNSINVVKNADGTYTFVMPSSKVTVSAEFKATNVSDLYDDVRTNDWFYPEVKWANEAGYMNGTGNKRFTPNGKISESAFVQVLSRLAKADTSKYTSDNYEDIESGKWYSDAAKWARAVGILGNERFSAMPPCERGKLAIMIVRYFDSQEIKYAEPEGNVVIADESKMSDEELRAFRILVNAGIFKGKGNNVMDPAGATTRAELTTLLHRISDYTTIK